MVYNLTEKNMLLTPRKLQRILSQQASVHFKYYKQTFFIREMIFFESLPELI